MLKIDGVSNNRIPISSELIFNLLHKNSYIRIFQ